MPARQHFKLLFDLEHFGIRVNEITGKLARKGACPLWAQSRSKGSPNSTSRREEYFPGTFSPMERVEGGTRDFAVGLNL